MEASGDSLYNALCGNGDFQWRLDTKKNLAALTSKS